MVLYFIEALDRLRVRMNIILLDENLFKLLGKDKIICPTV